MEKASETKDLDLLEEVQGLKNILNVAQVVVSSLDLDEVLENILHSAMAKERKIGCQRNGYQFRLPMEHYS